MTNIEQVKIEDGISTRERKFLAKLKSKDIIEKYGDKIHFLHYILVKLDKNFDNYINNGKIWKLYNKCKRNKSLTAILQIYLKVQKKYSGKIDGIIGKQTLRGIKDISKHVDHNKYSSILKLEEFIEAIKKGELRTKKYKASYKNLLFWKKKGYKRVKMYYSGVRYDIVKIDDAIKVYEDMIKAGEISVNATKAGIRHAKDGNFNESAYRESAKKAYEHIESKGSLQGVISYAMQFRGLSEYKKEDRKKLKKLLEIDPKNTPWCAYFVKFILKKTFSNKNYYKKFSGTGGSVLGLNVIGYHVGIADGKGNYISGNVSGGKVELNKLNGFLGWVYPWDIGKKNKIHWGKDGILPPAGAIVVPYSYKSYLRRKNFYKEHYRRLAGNIVISSKNTPNTYNTYKKYGSHISKPKNPLDILKV